MDDIDLPTEELPEPLRLWLEEQPAVALIVEYVGAGRVRLRPLRDVEPQTLAHAQVTLAKYHEALMNLT